MEIRTEEDKKFDEIIRGLKSRKTTDPNFYNNPRRYDINPFLSIAEELLHALKKGLISELLIISSARQGKTDATTGSKKKGWTQKEEISKDIWCFSAN